jgi:hypothetical protein
MSTFVFRIGLVAASVGLPAMPGIADSPPTLKIESSCRAATDDDLRRTKQVCFDAERAAQATVAKNWPQYSPAIKSQCIGVVSHGGAQSYVELLVCLDTMKEADDIRKSRPKGAEAVRRTETIETERSERAPREPRESFQPNIAARPQTPRTANQGASPPRQSSRPARPQTTSGAKQTAPTQEDGSVIGSVKRFMGRILNRN